MKEDNRLSNEDHNENDNNNDNNNSNNSLFIYVLTEQPNQDKGRTQDRSNYYK
jgi:hypothetical protein